KRVASPFATRLSLAPTISSHSLALSSVYPYTVVIPTSSTSSGGRCSAVSNARLSSMSVPRSVSKSILVGLPFSSFSSPWATPIHVGGKGSPVAGGGSCFADSSRHARRCATSASLISSFSLYLGTLRSLKRYSLGTFLSIASYAAVSREQDGRKK